MRAVKIGLAAALGREDDPFAVEGERRRILALAMRDRGVLVLPVGVGDEQADLRYPIPVEENAMFGGKIIGWCR